MSQSSMSANPSPTSSQRPFLSLDAWALLVAFVLAGAVKLNVWQNIPW